MERATSEGKGAAEAVARCFGAWVESCELQARRALEGRMAELLREPIEDCVRGVLGRQGAAGGLSAADVLGQTVIELPVILAKYVDQYQSSRPEGFYYYVLAAARNIAADLAKRDGWERDRLARLASSRPSRFGRAPTTPSRKLMRGESAEFLSRAFEVLDPDEQVILRRVMEQGKEKPNLAEIARALELPRETVRDRYHAAVAKLARALEESFGGDPLEE